MGDISKGVAYKFKPAKKYLKKHCLKMVVNCVADFKAGKLAGRLVTVWRI